MPVDPRERDPRFPDRPNHEDFFTLSEAVQEIDQQADDGESILDIMGVDQESIEYMLNARIALFDKLSQMQGRGVMDLEILGVTYLDAFVLGKRFAEIRSNQKEE